MREVRAALAAFVLAAAAFPAVGGASTSSVQVMSYLYYRDVLIADPGTTVGFEWVHGGHTVTAMDGSFDSGLRPVGSTYYVGFSGGDLRYRCTLHSQIDEASGQCQGMCGVITERFRDTTAPVIDITSPRDEEVILSSARVLRGGSPSEVRIRGVASDDRSIAAIRVRVRHPNGWRESSVSCSGCGGDVATWDVTLRLLPGTYELQATAADPSANVGRSQTIRIVVL